MPAPPEGEADLRDLADQFMRAGGYVLAMVGEAAIGNRRRITAMALERLAALRLLDFRTPVVLAYIAENPWHGDPVAVDDLAGSLAKRLDQGARTAADGVRDTFGRVTPDNLDAGDPSNPAHSGGMAEANSHTDAISSGACG